MIFDSLRNRLFASFMAVLLIVLAVLAFVMVTLLSSRPVPADFTWNRLELMLTGFISSPTLRELSSTLSSDEQVTDVLESFAHRNDARVLLLAIDGDSARALYDTAGEYAVRDPVALRIADHNATRTYPGLQPVFGVFNDPDGDVWLFSGINRAAAERGRFLRNDGFMLAIAQPPSTESLQSALNDFGAVFLVPLVQAAMIGGIVAFLLALFISRGIARTMQALAKSAQHVARGEYNEQVPERGPVEIRQVASAFNRMTAEVRATQLSQREFLANVSHDLKTPLTSIQGYSQAIMDGTARNPESAAQIIHDEAERLNRMVTELTDLARLQAGRLSMKAAAIDVSAMVAGIAQRLAVVAARKKITLEAQTPPVPQIAGDGDRLVQVFTNLLSNAIKYTPQGGRVDVTVGVQRGGIEIKISDNGIGIPQDDLPRIFERFYQVDKSRGPQRGTGLGLAITYEIVQAHGGEIHIESSGANQGTTVTVWLPSPDLSTIVTRRAP